VSTSLFIKDAGSLKISDAGDSDKHPKGLFLRGSDFALGWCVILKKQKIFVLIIGPT
jgi:hypothetical protein